MGAEEDQQQSFCNRLLPAHRPLRLREQYFFNIFLYMTYINKRIS